MNYEFNSINQYCKFHNLNQWDEDITKMMCTYFAPAINLKYNCWIELTEKDLKQIALKDFESWKFSYLKWWTGDNWIHSVLNYVIEHSEARKWTIPNLIRFDSLDWVRLKKWLKRWYAIVIWINVNSNFYKDVKDDLTLNNYEDYISYFWKTGHFTNIAKWTRANPHDIMIDSYMKKWWSSYKLNIDKVLWKITMRTKYCFY